MSRSNPRFVMLVGIAGSGKSTYAVRFCECFCARSERATIFSSDDLREEYYGDAAIQGDHTVIFKEMNTRTLNHLAQGYTAIYDATNLSAKRRIELLKEVRAVNSNTNCICIFFQVSPRVCINRQELRDRVVPEDVIKRQYHQMDVPSYGEGWDKIYRAPQSPGEELFLYERTDLPNFPK